MKLVCNGARAKWLAGIFKLVSFNTRSMSRHSFVKIDNGSTHYKRAERTQHKETAVRQVRAILKPQGMYILMYPAVERLNEI